MGGNKGGILYFGTILGTLETTSMRFSGHEPPMVETMTHPKQWLREKERVEVEDKDGIIKCETTQNCFAGCGSQTRHTCKTHAENTNPRFENIIKEKISNANERLQFCLRVLLSKTRKQSWKLTLTIVIRLCPLKCHPSLLYDHKNRL